MIIHPAYDAERREWFATLPGGALIEATSLREMTLTLRWRKVGRFKIKDYYPIGHTMPRVMWPKEASRSEQRVTQMTKVVPRSTPPRVIAERTAPDPNHPSRKYDYELILDMWAKGFTGPQIGEHLGMTNWKTTADIITRARRRGDPRAVSRTRNPAWR